MKRMMKKGIKIILPAIFIALIFIAAALYFNLKNFTLKKVVMADGQEIYLMGTFHSEHFKRYANYSVEEMINAINNIEPDAVFIEARENSYTEYGVVDGPIDMCVAYCYCIDNNIPVEMIDYWKIDNDFKTGTTTEDRDDHINENIMEKRKCYENQSVLVVCGFGHLNAQAKRLIEAGGRTEHIAYVSSVFDGGATNFTYPSELCDVWEKRALFYGHTIPKLVQEDDTLNDDIKAAWAEDDNNAFYNRQMEYCKLFQNNLLYMD